LQRHQPTKHRTDKAIWNQEETHIWWIEDARLRVADEWRATEAVWAPEWKLSSLLPTTGQETLEGDVLGQGVRVVGIEYLAWMEYERPKERKGKRNEQGWVICGSPHGWGTSILLEKNAAQR
jgi:hypothetical protein